MEKNGTGKTCSLQRSVHPSGVFTMSMRGFTVHHNHVAAMLNKKRGLAGMFVKQYIKLDVTSLFHHLLYDSLFTKTRFSSVNRVYWGVDGFGTSGHIYCSRICCRMVG